MRARAGPAPLSFITMLVWPFGLPPPIIQAVNTQMGSLEASHRGVTDLSHARRSPPDPHTESMSHSRSLPRVGTQPRARAGSASAPTRALQILGWFVNPAPVDLHHSCIAVIWGVC